MVKEPDGHVHESPCTYAKTLSKYVIAACLLFIFAIGASNTVAIVAMRIAERAHERTAELTKEVQKRSDDLRERVFEQEREGNDKYTLLMTSISSLQTAQMSHFEEVNRRLDKIEAKLFNGDS